MSKIRWGILGVAKINERWLPGFRKAGNVELAAIASRDAAKAAAAAKAAGIPKSYGRYEDLLADPEIDVVYLPLPNSLHGEWACKAADAGKHVLCEKPLAATAGEAQRIVDHCRKRGVKLMDGFMWPYHDRASRIRELISEGTIGDVRRCCGTFTFQLDLSANNIRLRSDMGGGSLLDVGCYPIYGIRWAMGAEPVRVYARADMLHGVDTAMTGMMCFADGRMATFDCGFTLPLRQWFEIVGTDGVITVRDMWLPDADAEIELQRGEQAVETLRVGGRDQIACLVEAMARAIRDNREPAPPIDEAVKTLRVIEALALSARENRVVEIGAGR